MNLLRVGTPLNKLWHAMVEKLVTAAVAAIADNLILITENTQIWKHLLMESVISAEDVIRLKLAPAAKQRLLDQQCTGEEKSQGSQGSQRRQITS